MPSTDPPTRPPPVPLVSQNGTTLTVPGVGGKKRRHRGGRKRKNRRQSFAPPSEASAVASNAGDATNDRFDEEAEHDDLPIQPGNSFYKRRNRSSESIDSDTLLDHRHQTPARPRRDSRLNPAAAYRAGASQGLARSYSGLSASKQNGRSENRRSNTERQYSDRVDFHEEDEDEEEVDPTDRTPLMPIPPQHRSPATSGYGLFKSKSRGSSISSHERRRISRHGGGHSLSKQAENSSYDVNNPPSRPSSPNMNAQLADPMLAETDLMSRSPAASRLRQSRGDILIDIDADRDAYSAPPSPRQEPDGIAGLHKNRRTMTFGEEDVCFPTEAMSEMAEEEFDEAQHPTIRRHRKKREWPQLWVLDDWSREEKEDRASNERRAQRIKEPVLVDGMLRRSKVEWHRETEQQPFRYVYFNEEFESTIHAHTISELVPVGGSFRSLFIPDPPLLEESSSESEDEAVPPRPRSRQGHSGGSTERETSTHPAASRVHSLIDMPEKNGPPDHNARSKSALAEHLRDESRDTTTAQGSNRNSGENTPRGGRGSLDGATKPPKPPKYGDRPTFWLDVLNPTDQEMRVLAKSFGIHALTAEDIMMQEAREKVELFRNYYFINYRTFEQDAASEDYLDPINMYVVVFRHGILTFHFSQIPHPANVRRRIRQLKDYLMLSPDWISYAIIDDITDVYVPMIHNIEIEVDDIDDLILRSVPGASEAAEEEKKRENEKETKDNTSVSSASTKKRDSPGYNMLRRVGETRKKVMSLYRLLGNKADVIKGFAKRCNEQWDVAPKTEIGLYLGDIQDHILTMTSNLSHYEMLLSRAHSNYLAQVSIAMNERSEQTGDMLNKLTVLGTIVLPMNIIAGMWGMNVKVPGQDIDNLNWFWSITAGLFIFACAAWFGCKKWFGI